MSATQIEPYALQREEGEALWLLDSLSTIKATAASTGGALTLMEIHGRRGMAVPLHTHDAEDEGWYLLEGEVAFRVADQEIHASAGTFAYLPRGTAHGFQVRSPTARFLDIRTPAGFEGFFRAVGDPAPSRELPPPQPPQIERLAEAAPRYGMRIVGPPPGAA